MLIFDTETTHLLMPPECDLKDQPHMIEIGLIVLDAKYKEERRYTTLIKPGIPLNDEEHKTITKLTNEKLKDAPDFAAIVNDVRDVFRGQTKVIAHNCPFDMGVLVCELKRLHMEFAFPYPTQQVCSADYSASKYGKRLRLLDLYEKVIGKPLKQTHRAIDDAAALAEIVRKLKL